jgi:cytochrome c peroxidase
MSFNVLRQSVRRAGAFTAPAARSSTRQGARTGFRRAYSTTEPTGQKTSYTLPLGIAAVAAAAGGYYFFASDASREAQTLGKEAAQVAKAATHFTPSQDDYQKVSSNLRYLSIRAVLTQGNIGLQRHCGDHGL